MKILAIRIKNLASLEGITEIDFTTEPLHSAGIFAITGPTGAGKSTILDSLCLALYAQTPRYDKSSDPNQSIVDISGNHITQSDPRKILRDGAADGYAEVDFIGVDGHRYRSHWSVRRARNKVDGALQAYQVTCKDLDTNTDVQGTKTEVLAIVANKVGLTFDQFTRAVMLAQGDFTAFLKAPTSEKSELLEKLTGTQIYSEISKRVFEHHRQEKEELEKLVIRKQEINVLTNEELDSLKQRKTELSSVLLEKQKIETDLTKELAWHTELKSIVEKIALANTNYESALAAENQLQPRKEKLSQLESVQATRTWMQNIAVNRKKLSENETQQNELKLQFQSLQDQKQALDESLKSIQQIHIAAIKAQEEAIPQLNTAKKLDVQLNERLDQQKLAEKDFEDVKSAATKTAEELVQQQKKSDELKETIQKRTDFIEKNKGRQTLAENAKLILAGLNDAKKILEEDQVIAEKIQETDNAIKEKQTAVAKQDVLVAEVKTEVETLAQKLLPLQQHYAETDRTLFQNEKSELEKYMQEIMQALTEWKTLFDATASLEKAKATLQKNKQEFENSKKKLEELSNQLTTAKTSKEGAYRALEIAKQESAESVVSLREQLTEDHPCPVCGSKEHPYSDHDPRLNNVLKKLEADYNQHEEHYRETIKAHSALEERITQLEKEIKTRSEEQVLKEHEIAEYKANWKRIPLHAEAEKQPVEEITSWLKQEFEKQQVRQTKFKEREEALQKQQQELEALKKQHAEAIEKQQAADNLLKDLNREFKSLNELLAQTKTSQQKIKTKLESIKTSLSEYFSDNTWFEKWKSNTDGFTQEIQHFANEWKLNAEELNKTQNEHAALAAALKQLENQLAALTADLTKKGQTVSGIKQQHESLVKERKQLFEGKPADQIEQQLKAAIEKSQADLEQRKSRLQENENQITRATAQQEGLQKETERLVNEIKELNTKVSDWLIAHNADNNYALTLNELETLLAVSPEAIEKERKAILEIHSAFEKSQAVLEEHKNALTKHKEQPLSDRDKDVVEESLAAAKKSREETMREDIELGVKLKHDEDNRKTAGALLEKISAQEKITESWAMLNTVIGSADGKKFRQIAQEYTLDVLLQYTNIQLDLLSKRYLLQRIPQSLGLQVVDQDMGNETRTVNSLSGGESFLVSLALALGLASLSSSRMQVESLFIDEGFGSLDPNTLNVAMDALERLHNQGRKVGVISHVQEMTERIPVQIKVSKQNGGKSGVTIAGN